MRSLSHLLGCSETLLVRDGVARLDDFRPFQRQRMARFGRDDAFCDPVSKDLFDRLSHGSRSLSRSDQVNIVEIIQVKLYREPFRLDDTKPVLLNLKNLFQSSIRVDCGNGLCEKGFRNGSELFNRKCFHLTLLENVKQSYN